KFKDFSIIPPNYFVPFQGAAEKVSTALPFFPEGMILEIPEELTLNNILRCKGSLLTIRGFFPYL
ncbi:MAG: hypothetical protein ACXVBT_08235, partial [Flavisolibacter sp.]